MNYYYFFKFPNLSTQPGTAVAGDINSALDQKKHCVALFNNLQH